MNHSHSGEQRERFAPMTREPEIDGSVSEFGFSSERRVRRGADFERAYQRRASASDGRILVFVVANGLPHSRLGLSVSRKVGGAVTRNLWKRRLREAFRLNGERLPISMDIVVVPRASQCPPLGELAESLIRLADAAAARVRRPRGPNRES